MARRILEFEAVSALLLFLDLFAVYLDLHFFPFSVSVCTTPTIIVLILKKIVFSTSVIVLIKSLDILLIFYLPANYKADNLRLMILEIRFAVLFQNCLQ